MARTIRVLVAAFLAAAPQVAAGARCATGLRHEKPGRFVPVHPLPRRAAFRKVAPVPVASPYFEHSTEHFRILWGTGYDPADPDWADGDGDGLPMWVEVLGEALESAYGKLTELGFPDPYGAGPYYLDVYVANTGLKVWSSETGRYESVTVTSNYYAYTEIDTEYGVAYFVFNDDFSAHVDDELAVLRATAAHELFHAVQRSLGYPWDDEDSVPDSRWREEGWWFEATATWMEEVVTPEVDDYVTYVREFLSHPEDPLTSQDGLHEYGAAIFPGFLWLRYGPDLWLDVFFHAYGQGLESALADAAAGRDGATLEELVAAFWTLAAHPEDFWPDGAAYRANAIPRLSRDAASLPADFTSGFSAAPGRFGANLFRLPAPQTDLALSFQPAAPARAMAAVSREGDPATTVADLQTGIQTVPLPEGEGAVYAAVVNAGEANLNYSVSFGMTEGASEATVGGDGGAGTGGVSGSAGGSEVSTVSNGSTGGAEDSTEATAGGDAGAGTGGVSGSAGGDEFATPSDGSQNAAFEMGGCFLSSLSGD